MYEEILAELNVAVYVNRNEDRRIVSVSFCFRAKKCESVRNVTADHNEKNEIIHRHVLSLFSFVFFLKGSIHIC